MPHATTKNRSLRTARDRQQTAVGSEHPVVKRLLSILACIERPMHFCSKFIHALTTLFGQKKI